MKQSIGSLAKHIFAKVPIMEKYPEMFALFNHRSSAIKQNCDFNMKSKKNRELDEYGICNNIFYCKLFYGKAFEIYHHRSPLSNGVLKYSNRLRIINMNQ